MVNNGIIYVSNLFDSSDIRIKNSIGDNLVKNIQNNGLAVHHLPGKRSLLELPFIIKRKTLALAGIRYLKERELLLLKHEATIRSKIINKRHEKKICSFGTLPVAFLNTNKDIYIYTDTTFAGIHNLYTEFSDLSKSTIAASHKIEELAFSKAKKIFMTSDWARDSAINFYGVDPNKIEVIEFGANLIITPTDDQVASFLNSKSFDTIRLAFIGVDWKRKGASTALEVAQKLHSLGKKVQLDFVGCRPEFETDTPEYVISHGMINKSNSQGAREFEELIGKAHFMILPTQADTFGQVFCEANAYAVPALTYDNLGVSTAVKHGINGGLFNLDSPVDSYVKFILDYIENKEKYFQLCRSSHNEYKTRLNWDTVAKKIINGMFEL